MPEHQPDAPAVPDALRQSLDQYAARHLILSWRYVLCRGIVVVGADMAEHDLPPELAEAFTWGLSSAACAIHDGEAGDGSGGEVCAAEAVSPVAAIPSPSPVSPEPVAAATVLSEDTRIRLARAMYDSIELRK